MLITQATPLTLLTNYLGGGLVGKQVQPWYMGTITTDVEWVKKLEEQKEAKALVEATKEARKMAKAQKKVSKGAGGVKKPKEGKKKASRWA